MSRVAIITARGGSKRIPRKNIKEFCGKPILAFSIEAALKSKLFDEVMVSTEDSEIAEVAKKYGASVPFMRSERTANDFATTEDVLLEVLDEYNKRGKDFSEVCCIYPTAPFVTAEKIIIATEMLESNDSADSVMPVVQFSFPPQRGLIVKGDYISYKYPENAIKRSQDLEPIYHDCGQFYFCKTASLKKYHDVVGEKTLPLVVSELEVQDIDNLSDWVIAELKYKTMMEKKIKCSDYMKSSPKVKFIPSQR